MLHPIHDYIRRVAMDTPEGDTTKKFRAQPKIKPPRRKPSVQNESSREDYMKEYMKDYRKEEGKDYQKMPAKIKELRKRQRQEKKKTQPVNGVLNTEVGRVGIGIGIPIPLNELCITDNNNNVLIIS